MAKRRVYELARELNMTNRELIDKLQDFEVEVKSHMSSLEETTVNTVKEKLFGHKEKTEIEDTRVKPNIIRRRRKRRAETSAKAEAEEHAGETAEETPEPPQAEPETPAPEQPAEPAAKTTTEQPPTEEAAESEQTTEPPPEIPEETPAETAGTEPASAEQPADSSAETTPSAEAEAAADTAGAETAKPDEEPPAAEAAPEQKPPAEETRAPEPADRESAAEEDSSAAAAETQGPAPEKSEEQTVPPKKAKKKTKKSTAAKIISLPEEKEESPAEKPAAEVKSEQAAQPAKPETEGRKDKKTRRKKEAPASEAAPIPTGEEKPEKTEKGKKGKKKASFKRKEVVEGDALYDQRFGRNRKSRKKGKAAKPAEHKPQITTPKAIKRRIKIDDTIVIADLAKRMGVKANELIKMLMNMGIMVTVNQTIDFDTASLLAAEFNFEAEKAAFEEESVIQTEEDAPEQLKPRPPVVTIMGHVDHGKTSLLDVIRHSKITAREAGGITQHIGAYRVPHDTGDIIFLDTPGHEAFTAMRSRGAQVTDIVILVVAADDGVMPQTMEAIDHSKAAGVPIIVAVNKIDKPGAEPDRIRRQLAEKDIVPEDWGGDTIFVDVSAKQETGLDDLLEMVILQAEVLELSANPDKMARGYIIESRLETGRGPVATVLISEGTLQTGEAVVSGMYYGKIRAMFDDRGNPVKSATPSYPVEIIGLTGVPMAGDELITIKDEKNAKQISEHRLQKQRSVELAKTSRMSLEKLYEKMQEGEVRDLNLIIKADVQGSIEALKDSLTRLSTDEVKINVIHSATGTIHESDVSLAAVSNAIIMGFNVRPTGKVTQLADEEHVDIRYYNVIYDAIKDIKDAMVGLMKSHYEDRVLGRAEVRQVFQVPSVGAVAGCMVLDGKIQRNQSIRVVRDGIVIHDGKLASLRRYKDDVREVFQNYECGIGIERFNDIKEGDILESYYLEEIKPVLE
ncbi:MAG: translation initiation factor IF-2 [Thermodesulfobacteriota bacterium]